MRCYKKIVIENWESVALKLWTANDYIAASIFSHHFKFIKGKLDITSKRKIDDLNVLWQYIKGRNLCVVYPDIIQKIFELRYVYDYWQNGKTIINDQESKFLTNITLDVIEIIFTSFVISEYFRIFYHLFFCFNHHKKIQKIWM